MSYEKTTWATGDIITAEKMNNIENGIASAENKLIKINATVSGSGITLGKTWQEIYDLMSAGSVVYTFAAGDESVTNFIVTMVYIEDNVYVVVDSSNREYTCATSDGYPVKTSGGGN